MEKPKRLSKHQAEVMRALLRRYSSDSKLAYRLRLYSFWSQRWPRANETLDKMVKHHYIVKVIDGDVLTIAPTPKGAAAYQRYLDDKLIWSRGRSY